MATEGFDNSTQASLTGNDSSIAEALAQPEPTQPEPGPGASASPDIGADTQPDPGTEEAQPEVEAAPEIEEGEETTPEPEGSEEETDDWLPTDQEKEFPIETLARYAERYGYSLEQLQGDANLQRLITDSLNSNLAMRDRAAEADYIVADSDQAQPVITPEEQVRRQQERQQRSHAFVGDVMAKVYPTTALLNQLGLDLYRAFGVDPDKLTNWDQEDERAQVLASAPKVGATLARHMVDGVYTALPHLLLSPDPNSGQFPLQQLFEAVMPGIGEMWERSSYMKSWARAAHEVGGELPAYGTPEFTQALEEAAEKIPGFEDVVYRDAKGQVLRPHEQAYRKYVLLAKAISAGKKKPATGPVSKKQQGIDPLEEAIKHQNARW